MFVNILRNASHNFNIYDNIDPDIPVRDLINVMYKDVLKHLHNYHMMERRDQSSKKHYCILCHKFFATECVVTKHIYTHSQNEAMLIRNFY